MLINIRINQVIAKEVIETHRILKAIDKQLQEVTSPFIKDHLEETRRHYKSLQDNIIHRFANDEDFTASLVEGIENF